MGDLKHRNDKRQLTEADIRTEFINPALVGTGSAKWNVTTRLREDGYANKSHVIVWGETVVWGEANKAGQRWCVR